MKDVACRPVVKMGPVLDKKIKTKSECFFELYSLENKKGLL